MVEVGWRHNECTARGLYPTDASSPRFLPSHDLLTISPQSPHDLLTSAPSASITRMSTRLIAGGASGGASGRAAPPTTPPSIPPITALGLSVSSPTRASTCPVALPARLISPVLPAMLASTTLLPFPATAASLSFTPPPSRRAPSTVVDRTASECKPLRMLPCCRGPAIRNA